MNYFLNIIHQKSIVRLAFVVCGPLLWAATCQTSPVQPAATHHVQTFEHTDHNSIDNRDGQVQSLDSTQAKSYTKDELLGRFEPSEHPDFERIQSAHTSKAGIYMQRLAYAAFQKMFAAAQHDGHSLIIISATRNFNYQKGIWEKKWLREKYKGMSDRDKVADILKYSSMPGTSRHHWGTDVDFNAVELNYWRTGAGAQLYKWLEAHAAEYGFYQTYTQKDQGRTGYEEEKWHWSYMPLAREMHRQYRATIGYSDITGFSGCKEAEALKVFETYVDGIAAELVP